MSGLSVAISPTAASALAAAPAAETPTLHIHPNFSSSASVASSTASSTTPNLGLVLASPMASSTAPVATPTPHEYLSHTRVRTISYIDADGQGRPETKFPAVGEEESQKELEDLCMVALKASFIKTNAVNGVSIPRSFFGSEFVDWYTTEYPSHTRTMGLTVAQRLVDTSRMDGVDEVTKQRIHIAFADNLENLYRFDVDRGRKAYSMSKFFFAKVTGFSGHARVVGTYRYCTVFALVLHDEQMLYLFRTREQSKPYDEISLTNGHFFAANQYDVSLEGKLGFEQYKTTASFASGGPLSPVSPNSFQFGAMPTSPSNAGAGAEKRGLGYFLALVTPNRNILFGFDTAVQRHLWIENVQRAGMREVIEIPQLISAELVQAIEVDTAKRKRKLEPVEVLVLVPKKATHAELSVAEMEERERHRAETAAALHAYKLAQMQQQQVAALEQMKRELLLQQQHVAAAHAAASGHGVTSPPGTPSSAGHNGGMPQSPSVSRFVYDKEHELAKQQQRQLSRWGTVSNMAPAAGNPQGFKAIPPHAPVRAHTQSNMNIISPLAGSSPMRVKPVGSMLTNTPPSAHGSLAHGGQRRSSGGALATTIPSPSAPAAGVSEGVVLQQPPFNSTSSSALASSSTPSSQAPQPLSIVPSLPSLSPLPSPSQSSSETLQVASAAVSSVPSSATASTSPSPRDSMISSQPSSRHPSFPDLMTGVPQAHTNPIGVPGLRKVPSVSSLSPVSDHDEPSSNANSPAGVDAQSSLLATPVHPPPHLDLTSIPSPPPSEAGASKLAGLMNGTGGIHPVHVEDPGTPMTPMSSDMPGLFTPASLRALSLTHSTPNSKRNSGTHASPGVHSGSSSPIHRMSTSSGNSSSRNSPTMGPREHHLEEEEVDQLLLKRERQRTADLDRAAKLRLARLVRDAEDSVRVTAHFQQLQDRENRKARERREAMRTKRSGSTSSAGATPSTPPIATATTVSVTPADVSSTPTTTATAVSESVESIAGPVSANHLSNPMSPSITPAPSGSNTPTTIGAPSYSAIVQRRSLLAQQQQAVNSSPRSTLIASQPINVSPRSTLIASQPVNASSTPSVSPRSSLLATQPTATTTNTTPRSSLLMTNTTATVSGVATSSSTSPRASLLATTPPVASSLSSTPPVPAGPLATSTPVTFASSPSTATPPALSLPFSSFNDIGSVHKQQQRAASLLMMSQPPLHTSPTATTASADLAAIIRAAQKQAKSVYREGDRHASPNMPASESLKRSPSSTFMSAVVNSELKRTPSNKSLNANVITTNLALPGSPRQQRSSSIDVLTLMPGTEKPDKPAAPASAASTSTVSAVVPDAVGSSGSNPVNDVTVAAPVIAVIPVVALVAPQNTVPTTDGDLNPGHKRDSSVGSLAPRLRSSSRSSSMVVSSITMGGVSVQPTSMNTSISQLAVEAISDGLGGGGTDDGHDEADAELKRDPSFRERDRSSSKAGTTLVGSMSPPAHIRKPSDAGVAAGRKPLKSQDDSALHEQAILEKKQAAVNKAQALLGVSAPGILNRAVRRAPPAAVPFLNRPKSNSHGGEEDEEIEEPAPLNLSDVLETPQYRLCLEKYMEKQFCAESLHFLAAEQAYQRLASREQRMSSAALIYAEFVATDAHQKINISASTCSVVDQKRDRKEFDSSLFNKAAKEVYNMVESDVYRRFCTSPDYFKMISDARSMETETLRSRRRAEHSFAVVPLEETYTELEEIAEEFGKSAMVRDTWYHLKKYVNCFRGKKLVDWLMEVGKAKNRATGVAIGQRMYDASILRHVVDECEFEDSNELFTLINKESMRYQGPSVVKLLAEGSIHAGYLLLKGVHYNRVYAVLSIPKAKLYLFRTHLSPMPLMKVRLKGGTYRFTFASTANHPNAFSTAAAVAGALPPLPPGASIIKTTTLTDMGHLPAQAPVLASGNSGSAASATGVLSPLASASAMSSSMSPSLTTTSLASLPTSPSQLSSTISHASLMGSPTTVASLPSSSSSPSALTHVLGSAHAGGAGTAPLVSATLATLAEEWEDSRSRTPSPQRHINPNGTTPLSAYATAGSLTSKKKDDVIICYLQLDTVTRSLHFRIEGVENQRDWATQLSKVAGLTQKTIYEDDKTLNREGTKRILGDLSGPSGSPGVIAVGNGSPTHSPAGGTFHRVKKESTGIGYNTLKRLHIKLGGGTTSVKEPSSTTPSNSSLEALFIHPKPSGD